MKEGDKLQSEKESLDKERRQISGLKKEAEEPHQVENLLSQFSVCLVFSTWCGFYQIIAAVIK